MTFPSTGTVPLPSWPDWPSGDRDPVVSSGFGLRSGEMHKGVDMAYPSSQLDDAGVVPWPGRDTAERTKKHRMPAERPVVAAGDGTVLRMSEVASGRIVVISHLGLGDSPGQHTWETKYLHLDRSFVVKGDTVRAGQVIGWVGADPRKGRSKFRHLHFELWRDGKAVNPEPWMNDWRVLRGNANTAGTELPEVRAKWGRASKKRRDDDNDDDNADSGGGAWILLALAAVALSKRR